MTIIDRLFLLLTGLIALYLIWHFWKKQKEQPCGCNVYYIISFLVLLISGLLLIFGGWGLLANNLVAVVASLIPFSLATGLIYRFYKKAGIWYLLLMLLGLILIIIARFAGMESMNKVVYPLFHAIAGLTIVLVPIIEAAKKTVKGSFVWVAIGGIAISLGGMALAFLKAGKQLLFFSQNVVMTILAPLLFLVALFFAIGFVKGD